MDIRNRFAVLLHENGIDVGPVLNLFDQVMSESHLPVVREDQDDVLKAYLISLGAEGCSAATLKNYTLYLRKFTTALCKPVDQILPFDIRAYLVKYKQTGVADSTLDHIRICLKGFFEWCFNEGLIPKNPMVNISKIHFVQEKGVPLSPLQIEKLRQTVKNDLRMSALVEATYSSGCRVSEILSIKVADVKWDAKPVSVHIIGKGKKPADVYFSDRAVLLMQEYLQKRKHDSEWLFCNDRGGGQMHRQNVEKFFRKFRDGASAEFLTPHTLRRTLGTNVAHSAGVHVAQQVLRHSNINTTMRYVTTEEEESRRLYGRVIK